jgi:hypothetical protein
MADVLMKAAARVAATAYFFIDRPPNVEPKLLLRSAEAEFPLPGHLMKSITNTGDKVNAIDYKFGNR